MFKLAIIVGTDRPNSKSQVLANYINYTAKGGRCPGIFHGRLSLGSVVGGPYGKDLLEVEAFREPILPVTPYCL